MRKQQKTAIPFESVTTSLLKDAVRVKNMREVEKRYSASLIYKTHNAIFSLSEKTETCSSCLLSRSRAIVDFVNQYDGWAGVKTREVNARKAQEAEDLRKTNALPPDPRTAEQIEEDARKAQEEVRRLEAGEVDIFPAPLTGDTVVSSPRLKHLAPVPSEIDNFMQEQASVPSEIDEAKPQEAEGVAEGNVMSVKPAKQKKAKQVDDLTDF